MRSFVLQTGDVNQISAGLVPAPDQALEHEPVFQLDDLDGVSRRAREREQLIADIMWALEYWRHQVGLFNKRYQQAVEKRIAELTGQKNDRSSDDPMVNTTRDTRSIAQGERRRIRASKG
jgi:hypothetical protein